MRSALVLAALAAALAVAAPDAATQQARTAGGTSSVQQARTVTATTSVQPAWSRPAAPLPARLSPAVRAVSEPVAVEARSPWRYPMYGMLIGAVAGAAFGTYVMATTEEWLAPPAHLGTIPAGALAGLAIGGIANLVDRP